MDMNNGRGWNRNQNHQRWRGNNRGGRGGNRGWGDRNSFRGSGQQGFRGKFQDNYGGRDSKQWNNRQKRDTPGKRLTEEDIGVTEFISKLPGFNGIIKSRYSDFQVSEINEEGRIAKLTDMKAPEPEKDEVEEDEDLLLSKYNLELLPTETWDRINALAVATVPSDEKVQIDVTGMSKEQRTEIHDAVKKAFAESIVGSTVTVDDKKYVCFTKYRKGVRIDNRVKWMWPGEYVHFVVHKENCDTMDAALRIAERLRLNIKPSMIGYAGTKDRRAKTSQWFSLRKVDPRKIMSGCRGMRDVFVGNYEFSDRCLKLGMLKGNRFRVALRNVTGTDEQIAAACNSLQKNGFINYYGLQRFGARIHNPTSSIGMLVLQGNFQQAIDGILDQQEGLLQRSLQHYKAGDIISAVRDLPRAAHNGIEGRLIRALAKNPRDLVSAFSQLPRNNRLLYVHSYQSLLWNRCVSERIRRFGLTPAVGDLVPLETVEEVLEDANDLEGEEQNNDEEVLPDDVIEEKQNVETKAQEEKAKIPVKVLTQEDIDSGRYTMFDVILPLPGSEIEYPPNIKDYYEELLTKDGLTLQLSHKLKSYRMSGAYRHVLVLPSSVEWKCVRYSDPRADLLPSDLDDFHNRTLAGLIEDGKYKALLLTLSLPSSCYATMALREILKIDTSTDNQASLNDYHQAGKCDKVENVSTDNKGTGNNEGGNEKADENEKSADETIENENKRKLTDESDVEAKRSKQDVDE